MFKINHIFAALAAAVSFNTFAAAPNADYTVGVAMCDARASFAHFSPALGENHDNLTGTLDDVGCIKALRHTASDVVLVTDKGVRFERMSLLKKSLVRVVAADGELKGYVAYRGFMYAPQERAAVDLGLGRSGN